MFNCPTFFLFWKCLDDMSYWTNLYRTVADNELHFFTVSNLNYTVFVSLAHMLRLTEHCVICLCHYLVSNYGRPSHVTSSLDFTHSRRKGWNLFRKLSSGQQLPSSTRPSVKPNAVASHLVKVGKAQIEHQVKREITKEWRAYRRRPLDEGTATVTPPISPEEIDAALKNMKCGKAPGYDNIHPEFLKNLGPRARKWLAIFLTRIISEKNLHKSWIIAKNSRHP